MQNENFILHVLLQRVQPLRLAPTALSQNPLGFFLLNLNFLRALRVLRGESFSTQTPEEPYFYSLDDRQAITPIIFWVWFGRVKSARSG
jgi:hypothetical protein